MKNVKGAWGQSWNCLLPKKTCCHFCNGSMSKFNLKIHSSTGLQWYVLKFAPECNIDTFWLLCRMDDRCLGPLAKPTKYVPRILLATHHDQTMHKSSGAQPMKMLLLVVVLLLFLPCTTAIGCPFVERATASSAHDMAEAKYQKQKRLLASCKD